MTQHPRGDAAPLHPDTEMLLRRRGDAAAVSPSVSPSVSTSTPAPVWGIALSGGGIRSATLSLGVLQAVAATPASGAAGLAAAATDAQASAPPGAAWRSSLLSRIEYLSTVSGGGYIGAFLCSLFLPRRLRAGAGSPQAAADDAVRALCNEPPGRLRADAASGDADIAQAPLGWLRDNGRYLSPAGGGDSFYALGMALRNWIALHYVIGTVLLSFFAAMALLTESCSFLRAQDALHLGHALAGIASPRAGWIDTLWWSPLSWLALAASLAWVLPTGLAFWLPQPVCDGTRNRRFNAAVGGYLLLLVLFLVADLLRFQWLGSPAAGGPPSIGQGVRAVLQDGVWIAASAVVAGALALYFVNGLFIQDTDGLRVRATRQLMAGLIAVAVLLLLAVIDTGARSLYLALHRPDGGASAVAPAAVVAALVALVRRLAFSTDGRSLPDWLRRLPLSTLGGAVGLALMMLVGVLWSLLVLALQWQGHPPDVAVIRGGQQGPLLAALLVLTLLLAWMVGRFPSFINLSSLQSFYAARLTRAYLGASNGRRFRDAADRASWSVAEPHPDDGVSLEAFLQPRPTTDAPPALATLAPLHLINVTMNETIDPAEQLVQRDRKGRPLLVMPLGFTIDGAFHTFECVRAQAELQKPLQLGQWIGVSGAAFSTGIGRETSLGLSLLMGAANVRLGSWWESGVGEMRPRRWLTRLAERLFRTQTYLLQEFLARFHGLRRRWQYLSDGGHFENTALYELLRPNRGLRFVIACDNGADPDYEFQDLANLIRLVRIDMQLELEVDTGVCDDPLLRPWFGTMKDFRRSAQAADPQAPEAIDPHEPVALLLKSRPGNQAEVACWVLLFKPRVRRDSAADVLQYHWSHPKFPQEPTADQFFDEAQWESYRKLGHDNAAHLFSPEVWQALQDYIAGPA